jgi:hypothetical protein
MPFKRFFLCSLFLVLCCSYAVAQQEREVTTAMNKISLKFRLSRAGIAEYAVSYNGKPVILTSRLGFKLNTSFNLDSNFQLVTWDSLAVDETWKPVWGEVSRIRNHYKQLTIRLQQKTALAFAMNFRCSLT